MFTVAVERVEGEALSAGAFGTGDGAGVIGTRGGEGIESRLATFMEGGGGKVADCVGEVGEKKK